ncbi:copper amine oxidase [Glutamicibacter uratoxydans]|uniref:copper amine oxidase n=1 Tax=Glutamicibacter uratoxydans TaxID=43667 RepID=UPI001141E6BA|nr:copper amine oxidase [Glutamicibacter uratoxydans]
MTVQLRSFKDVYGQVFVKMVKTLCLVSAALLAGCQAGTTAASAQDAAAGKQQEQAVPADCSEGQSPLSQKMSSGATWSLCFSVDPKLGMVLSDVAFAPPGAEPIKLISSMSLAQLEVPYDDGGRMTSDITTAGFGGPNMHSLTETECAGDLLEHPIPTIGDGKKFGKIVDRPVLCSDMVDAGLSYRSGEVGELLAKRKDDWQLSTISKVGWYEYINQITFGADGTIRPSLGATGDLSPADYSDKDHGSAVGEGQQDHASSHSHNAVWKIDWALGGEAGQQIEQYDTRSTGKEGKHSPVVEGKYTKIASPATGRWKDSRWWKVSAPSLLNEDGHVMSYEIDMGKTDSFTFVDDARNHQPSEQGAGSGTEEIGYDVAFTNADECQVYATYNRGGCGRGVLDYVKDQKRQKLDDVVSWVAVGYHHVPRDEEQSPMEVHWQGFNLVPRDLTATRIDPPEERKDLNGQPDNWDGQMPPEEE